MEDTWYKTMTIMMDENHTKFKKNVAEAFHEHFWIPCDLCRKCFGNNDECPEAVQQCNSASHWLMVMERIGANNGQ